MLFASGIKIDPSWVKDPLPMPMAIATRAVRIGGPEPRVISRPIVRESLYCAVKSKWRTSKTEPAKHTCLVRNISHSTITIFGRNPDLGALTGYQYDSSRSTNTAYPPNPDRNSYTNKSPDWFGFGSAHTTIFQMVFCDGSVHQVPFEVNSEVHRALGNRKDGTVNDDLGF